MIDWFTFEVPGQPPSWNRSYRIVAVGVKDKWGNPVLNDTGAPKRRSTMMKTQATADYQQAVGLIVRARKPQAFLPQNQIIVAYHFHLKRDMDCDNVMKAMNDAIAHALGVDDKRFLPVPLVKVTKVKDPYVRVTLYDADRYCIEVRQK